MQSLYQESAYYRMLFQERRADVPLYLQHSEALGEATILEIGIGDGRVAIPLAEEGRHVFGVDSSPDMLRALASRLEQAGPGASDRVMAIEADAKDLSLGRRFERVFMPFNVLAHFHGAEALDRVFAGVRDHLAPDGHLVLDVMIPDPALLQGGGSSCPWMRHPRTDVVCRVDETYHYSPLEQVLRIETTLSAKDEQTPPQTLALELRQFFPQETRLLLRHHGFEILKESGEIGDSLAYVCKLAP